METLPYDTWYKEPVTLRYLLCCIGVVGLVEVITREDDRVVSRRFNRRFALSTRDKELSSLDNADTTRLVGAAVGWIVGARDESPEFVEKT